MLQQFGALGVLVEAVQVSMDVSLTTCCLQQHVAIANQHLLYICVAVGAAWLRSRSSLHKPAASLTPSSPSPDAQGASKGVECRSSLVNEEVVIFIFQVGTWLALRPGNQAGRQVGGHEPRG